MHQNPALAGIKRHARTLFLIVIPALVAHLTNNKNAYSDNKYYELRGQVGHLIGHSGIGKAQITHLVETIMRLLLNRKRKGAFS